MKELSTVTLPIDLTCTITNTTVINYSIVQIGTNPVPSWVSLGSNNASLVMTTPDVATNTTYTFYVQANVNGLSYLKTIKIQVIDTTIIKTTSTTSTPTVIGILSSIMIFASAAVVFWGCLSALTGSSSTSLIWSLVNLYQLMMLLPLIGAYIHVYVVEFIKGVQFSVFSFSYFDNQQQAIINKLSCFEWKQDNQYLIDIGAQSCSTIINISSSVTAVYSKLEPSQKWSKKSIKLMKVNKKLWLKIFYTNRFLILIKITK